MSPKRGTRVNTSDPGGSLWCGWRDGRPPEDPSRIPPRTRKGPGRPSLLPGGCRSWGGASSGSGGGRSCPAGLKSSGKPDQWAACEPLHLPPPRGELACAPCSEEPALRWSDDAALAARSDSRGQEAVCPPRGSLVNPAAAASRCPLSRDGVSVSGGARLLLPALQTWLFGPLVLPRHRVPCRENPGWVGTGTAGARRARMLSPRGRASNAPAAPAPSAGTALSSSAVAQLSPEGVAGLPTCLLGCPVGGPRSRTASPFAPAPAPC